MIEPLPIKDFLVDVLKLTRMDADKLIENWKSYQEAMKMANPIEPNQQAIGERIAAKTLLGGKISNGKVDTIYLCGYNNTPDETYVLVTTVSVDSIYGMRRNIAQAIDAGIKEALEDAQDKAENYRARGIADCAELMNKEKIKLQIRIKDLEGDLAFGNSARNILQRECERLEKELGQ